MSSTPSTAHPHFFCRALYLLPSPNKLISCDSGATSPPQSLPRMGNTSSMSHPGQSLNRRQISATLTTNLFLVITALLRLWGFPLRSGDDRFALGMTASLWGSPIIPIIPKILRPNLPSIYSRLFALCAFFSIFAWMFVKEIIKLK